MATAPDTFGPYFFFSIKREGQTEQQIADQIDLSSLEWGDGDTPFEGMPNAAGGYAGKESPQEDGEVSFDTIDRDVAVAKWLKAEYAQLNDATEPIAPGTAITAVIASARRKYSVVRLFTNDPAVTTASGAVQTSYQARRDIGLNCRITSCKDSMGDGILKTSVTLKYTPRDVSGTSRNYVPEKSDGTAQLPAFTLP